MNGAQLLALYSACQISSLVRLVQLLPDSVRRENEYNTPSDSQRFLQFNEGQFRQEFRISRALFDHILSRLPHAAAHYGRRPLAPELLLMLFIKRLSNGSSTRDLATKFGVSPFSVIKSFRAINQAFFDAFRHHIGYATGIELAATMQHYEQRHSIPRCIGAVDGSYIVLARAPLDDPVSYKNRKKQFSVILQVLADNKYMIRNATVSHPGSCHDNTVYRDSDLHTYVHNTNYIVLADSAYTLTVNTLTPYSVTTTEQQVVYNNEHAAARVCVEQTFGQLKNRWRILKCLNIEWGVDAALAVLNCCILHNMCKLFNDADSVDDGSEDDSSSDDDECGRAPSPTSVAKRQRDEIAERMFV